MDIVERLRNFAAAYTTTIHHDALVNEAADVIERLRAEVKHYLHLQEDVAALRAENESLRKVFDAAENLVKVKGRFHSEQAYGRLVTAVAGMKVEE